MLGNDRNSWPFLSPVYECSDEALMSLFVIGYTTSIGSTWHWLSWAFYLHSHLDLSPFQPQNVRYSIMLTFKILFTSLSLSLFVRGWRILFVDTYHCANIKWYVNSKRLSPHLISVMFSFISVSSSMFQSSTFGFAGVFPFKYTSVVLSGQVSIT